MNKVRIELENCYGIGNFEHDFDFTKSNTFLIYAPNGTMKTSLAKTLRYFANKEEPTPRDQIYPERIAKFDLQVDGISVQQRDNEILIIDPEANDYDASGKISSFIASKELKDEYDAIYNQLDVRRKEFITKLKSVSQSSDCESEIISVFQKDNKDTFFDILLEVNSKLKSEYPKFDFKYNDIFDKGGKVKAFLEKHQNDLDTYVRNYDSLISDSSLFNKSDNSFGTYQAGVISKSIEDGSYFAAGHSLEVKGDLKITSASEWKELYESEIEKIVANDELKKVFEKVDKAIGANVDLRAFQKAIEKNNLLLVELKNYEKFKKKTWLGYLGEIKSELIDLHDFYVSKKKDLAEIVEKAKREQETWKQLVEQFNARFHVPFTVELSNQEDVILKRESAFLNFLYSDRLGGPQKQQERSSLFNNVLSRGEKRAFYILQILFDIESSKLSGNQGLIIFDDVADSFDYKNKYAIIEYIRDLHVSGKFRIIILTHNFDFYRTVATRLSLPRIKDFCAFLMAGRDDNGIISLNQGAYTKDIFKHFLKRFSEKRVFVSLIPFLRNIIEYTEGEDTVDYGLLTDCLHKKANTDSITVSQILNLWAPRFPSYNAIFQSISFGSEKIMDLLYNTSDEIITESIKSEIPLENKIVLSIAIRLKAEEFMIGNIPGLDLSKIESNQTQELFQAYKKLPSPNLIKIKTLDKVVLMTPENIHLNAFMYEPLIDLSLQHLINLYKEVKTL